MKKYFEVGIVLVKKASLMHIKELIDPHNFI